MRTRSRQALHLLAATFAGLIVTVLLTGSASGRSPSVVRRVAPALVDINSVFANQSATGAGTGIALNRRGLILTNNHVINGATAINVRDVGNGRTYGAVVLGYDASKDIAVIALTAASGLHRAKLARPGTARVGDAVMAIGNAGGSGGEPRSDAGRITRLHRSITAFNEIGGARQRLSGLIEVNAAIRPGDSGGPLVNAAGRVIGVDTAASVNFSLQQGAGRGFAIPIGQALAVTRQIEAGVGSATVHVGPTAFLGVLISSATVRPAGRPVIAGAQVVDVQTGSPAQQAGLTGGDVITSLNGRAVGRAASISRILVPLKPGDGVEIGWLDAGGQPHTATVTLGTGPPA